MARSMPIGTAGQNGLPMKQHSGSAPLSGLLIDELAALRQLARSGWGEIPDPMEDSSREALPLPDYFYLMLWRVAGENLSQIHSQHPQLLRIAHMSWREREHIWDKGTNMARAYQDHPGVLNPPGVEDNNDRGRTSMETTAPAQGTQDPIPNDSGTDAEELRVSGGLQREQPTDILAALHLGFGPLSDAGLRATGAADQHSRTDSGSAGSIQLGQTALAWHETTHMSEDTDSSQSEELDDSHDGDGTKKVTMF
ncbi:hypothetical protein BC629DRAFT_1118484 [Irpex lacteus]|nr:hypothetical protein BC629DRAFT_1118484 [Irpex lacteus]